MKTILIAILIGITAGIIDIIPMLIQKLNRRDTLSAFLHYVALGIIIPFVDCQLAPWLKGVIISLLTALPIIIIVYPREKKAVIPMLVFAILLGAGIGIAGARFIV